MARSNLFEVVVGMAAVDYIFNKTGKGTGGGPLAGMRDLISDATHKTHVSKRTKARMRMDNGIKVGNTTPTIIESAQRSVSDDFDDIPGYNPYR